MKFLIVLALAVAASQAAFTGSLVDKLAPQIQGLKIAYNARSSTEANFQTQLGEALSQSITNTLTQIQQAVEHAQNVAQILSNSVSNAVQQGVAIGQQAIHQGQTVLANLLSNILGALGSKSNRELPAALIAIIQQIGSNDAVLNVIHNTQLYQCLTAAGLEIEYSHLADLYYNNELLAAASAARPQVRACIEQQGGLGAIHDIVQPYVPTIVGLLEALNIRDLVHDTLVGLIGQDLYDQYVAPVLNSKGFLGNVVNSVSQSAQQLGQYVASVAQAAITQLAAKVEEIKKKVIEFVQNGLASAQQLTLQAAQNLVDALQESGY